MHVNFKRVNKMETMYGRSRLKVKPIAQLLRLHVAFHTLTLFHLREQILRAFARNN